MLKKYLFYISVLFIICHIPVFSQEQGPPDKPLPNLIISNDDYLTTRNNSQGDSQNNVNSYNGYYKPSSVNEPFNFKKTDDKLKAFPENNSNQEGYSGYYNNPPMEGYKFPEPSVAPESNQNNALELTDSDLLKGLDIKSKGIPIWKQTNRVNVEVNKIVERN